MSISEKIRTAPYEHAPVYFTRGGVPYVEPRELVRSAAFWREIEAMKKLRICRRR